jgi:hypothetical protein
MGLDEKLVARGKCKQGDVARLLDGLRKPPLMACADTRQAAGNDLATLSHELLQQANIAVGDRIDLFRAELAYLLAPEELASAAARTT